jgi:hypothetical protein
MSQRHLDLDPIYVRTIENGKYTLFGLDCPTEVMAAYERTWARRYGYMLQPDGDLLIGWVVEQSLMKGDFELAGKLRDAMEKLGWKPSTDTA